MLESILVTKIVRRHLRRPSLTVESWTQEQDGRDDSDRPVYRVQGYVTDLIAYEHEGTPIPFDIRFSLSNEG